jgi:hypothetical protein
MAGVKVTDLTTLGTADPADVMYIVDSSSNQSKQIEVQNIYSGMPQFESGSFVINTSGENDCIITPISAYYSRVNDVVTMTANFDFEIINGVVIASFNLTPPVASNFSTPRDCAGIVTFMNGNIADLIGFGIQADTVNNAISINVQAPSNDYNYQSLVANIQYLVI